MSGSKAPVMPVISLLTDFGRTDPYVGIMKAVIASVCPEARVIDISHDVAPQDVYQAAFMLSAAHGFFPHNSVHAVIVDPGVGSSRRIVAVRTSKAVFVVPDNGVLSLVLDKAHDVDAFLVENPEVFLHPVSRTFHGRDVFAPVAARLACGMKPKDLGPEIALQSLVRLDLGPAPHMDASGRLTGTVVYADRFGNLVSNVGRSHLEKHFSDPDGVCVQAGNQVISGLSHCYADAAKGGLLAIEGSFDMLEISVNQDSAARVLQMAIGDPVYVFVR
ncbi:MAG: SAM-dependent chlorinase/fluorinase [Desulfosalsimonas sp.]|uniref:SAM hydrolase/SAM-dependent halogenase family protein n=1 Tax=Desulfosalsimonas sp. TaxID=3073848 RepID=UPI003970802F